MDAMLGLTVIAILVTVFIFVHQQRSRREELGSLPAVTDDELWILREMETHGGARREFHPQRPSSGHAGDINSIWFGRIPVDYERCRWIYDLMEKDLKQKGLIESKGDRYSLLPGGKHVLRANRRRKIKSQKPIIDAKTGRPREEG
jgi:hypothetical protein